MTQELDREAFRLSRVYAAGWNAALRGRTGAAAAAGRRNPYTSEPEKSRWNEGFRGASGSLKDG